MRVGVEARRGLLDRPAIASHLQQLATPCRGLGVVCEQRNQARDASPDWRDAMYRVPALEQQQRPRMHRDPHYAFIGTLQKAFDARIILVAGVANQRYVFEVASRFRWTQRNR